MQLTFLGTGSAIAIPRAADGRRPHRRGQAVHRCPQCRSRDPHDRRQSSALLIDGGLLIDAGPAIADQLTSVRIPPRRIAAVILTHRHRDAAGGLRTLPDEIEVIHPRRARAFVRGGHRFQPIRVPHARRTWGYLIDGTVAYLPDYADIRPALPALRRARVAVLDGSGYKTAFPSHQPMQRAVAVVKRLTNLRHIIFTHVGHVGMPHRILEGTIRREGDRRFSVAYHGRKMIVRRRPSGRRQTSRRSHRRTD